MPRKAFVADLKKAADHLRIDHLSDVKAGEEDGTIIFKFHSEPTPPSTSKGVKISAIIPDVSEYPSAHMYILCTDGENVPQAINTVMQDIGDFSGLPIEQMLEKVVKALSKATAGSQANPLDLDDDDPMDIDGSDPEAELDDEDDPDPADSDDDWSVDLQERSSTTQRTTIKSSYANPSDRASVIALNQRIRRDLGYAKQAGFRVGHMGQLLNNGSESFVTISCRIAKLGISEEALQAWHLEPNLYYTLVIRFTSGYRTYAQLAQDDSFYGEGSVHVRVGLSRRYKITLSEAIDAFSKTVDKSREPGKDEEATEVPKDGLKPFFISRTLNELLGEKLMVLLRYRDRFAFGWDGAEEYYHDHQGMSVVLSDNLDAKYWVEDEMNGSLPSLVTADHLLDLKKENCMTREASFPLLAMQFALRHLVRCTEYCLVCHCRVKTDFEALKPYVCSKPLCLYQYMALGFGPTIEHEIIAQPHVVDLLVSFCYSSASTRGALKTFPVGMGLTVPSPDLIAGHALQAGRHGMHHPDQGEELAHATALVNRPPAVSHTARFDMDKMELIFAPEDQKRPLRLGSWVCLSKPGSVEQKLHCKVIEALYPVIRLAPPIVCGAFMVEENPTTTRIGVPTNGASNAAPTPAATPPLGLPRVTTTSKLPEIDFTAYDQNFDDLTVEGKQKTIRMLLDTLPSTMEMKDYLQKGKHATLQSWTDRLSPAALGVLRWIIASNRSCIVQVDNLDGQSQKVPEERVTGMPEYMQFRFAQGAPDKEQRFISSVRAELPHMRDSACSTIFAWHGSSLYNWHSIVREGLHYNEVVNGRAFGNGVYFSPHAQTSVGYSGSYFGHYHGSTAKEKHLSSWMWPHSRLRISDALSLNEIVNRPEKFQSSNPHLVVPQLDWIQTRYLFVKCNSIAVSKVTKEEVAPTETLLQDPKYTAMGASGEKVEIPLTAISKSRRPSTTKKRTIKGKAKLSSDKSIVELSDDTDVEDVSLFIPDEDELQVTTSLSASASKQAPKPREPAKTDFRPGTLDHSTLPMLNPPSYATPTASKTLQKELTATLKIQDATPLADLGWYIDRELISNVYQWIVELHSFDPAIPLAKDMVSRDLKSIVLEIRFPGTYPMAPPFVRVVRPRLLGFREGGGGHVTAGGALCMELLTNSGWSVASNLESVLVQVRAAISSTDPMPARLERGPVRDYARGEAVEAYVRACQTHGWSVPPDFMKSFGGGGGSGAGGGFGGGPVGQY